MAEQSPLAALVEPLRRELFLYVAASTEMVGRDEAASALGISRSVAAFHLDKLTDAGLLAVKYRRPPGRAGPGAGRPAKLYRSVEDELSFSVPERHYEVIASILAQAAAEAEAKSLPMAHAIPKAARRFGRAVGSRSESGGEATKGSFERVAEVLIPCGY